MGKELLVTSTGCVTGASNTATFVTSRVSGCVLLLASELLAIELCVGSAGCKLGPFDTTVGLIIDQQHGANRGCAAVWLMSLCGVWSALALSRHIKG